MNILDRYVGVVGKRVTDVLLLIESNKSIIA